MVHPSTLCPARSVPLLFSSKLHFIVIASLRICDIAEAVACIPGSFRRTSKDSVRWEARTTNESDAVPSAKHGCALSPFFQKRAGRSVHYNKIPPPLSPSPSLPPSLSLSVPLLTCTRLYAHSLTLARKNIQRAPPKILYVSSFMLWFPFNFYFF